MAKSSGGVSSLHRAVRLLETFHTGVRDLSATEIAESAGMPLSTTHRLLTELTELGLLERTHHRRYQIGLRLWELAVRTPGSLGIREIALPAMRAAHAVIGQHLQLGILDDGEVLHLERLSAPHATANFTIVGGRMPYHSTSSGLVLLSYADEMTREGLLARPLHHYQNAPLPNAHTLRKQLDAIREQGFVTTKGYVDPAATAIAVPVFDPFGKAVAALAAVVPTANPRERHVLSVLKPASTAITRAMRRHYGGLDPDPVG